MTRDPLRHWPLLQCDTLCLTEALLQHLTAARKSEKHRESYLHMLKHQICYSNNKVSHNLICTKYCMYLYIYRYIHIWGFPKIDVPQNGWFIREDPIKMDDLGVPLFSETPICICSFVHVVYIIQIFRLLLAPAVVSPRLSASF